MTIYINRILNLKKISAIGFDMDHTLVRYHYKNFEQLTFDEVVRKLCQLKKYPRAVKNFKFDYLRAIRGLVLDRQRGNLMKIGSYGRVKQVYHGHTEWTHLQLEETYRELVVDLENPNYFPIDTTFSIAFGALYGLLVELKDSHPHLSLPSYDQMATDLLELISISHSDDSLKSKVRENIEHFIVQDPKVVELLLRMKESGKLLLLITNSDFFYTKALLDYTINPFLKKMKNCSHWTQLFDYIITGAEKPAFFTGQQKFLSVDPQTGLMSNTYGKLPPGLYQGGNARSLQKDLGINGTGFLYLGDHIYGDIVTLKKSCNWRTALVIEELEEEVTALRKGAKSLQQVDSLMEDKVVMEEELNTLHEQKKQGTVQYQKKLQQLKSLDEKIGNSLRRFNSGFNPYWGEFMRAGLERSRFATQVEKYACIYMSQITDFLNYSTRQYFRPERLPMPHEVKNGKS